MPISKEELNIVAIIPARGGSKGLPKKNLVEVCGQPLISWSIEQAKSSNLISSTWVTSDDEEILNTAEKFGAFTINRPPELALDNSSSESAWIHAIDYIKKMNKNVDIVVGMQGTSPIREPDDLDKAISLFIDKKFDSLLTVTELEDYFIWNYDSKFNCHPKNYDLNNRKPRQELKKSYLENGSFYIFKPSLLKKNNNRLSGKIGMYLMDKYKSFQIDNEEDLKICSGIMKEYGMFNKNER